MFDESIEERMNATLNVQAIFDSIDGEVNAFHGAGQLTTFIRLKGCNLRCGYCDTKYSQEAEPENWMTIDEIVQKVHFPKVTITGGEPLLQPVVDLCAKLVVEKGCFITIETNGTIRPPHPYCTDVRYVVDYKLPSSGMLEHMHTEVFKDLRRVDVIKFVIADEYDYKYAYTVVVQNPDWEAKMVFSPALGRLKYEFSASKKYPGLKGKPIAATARFDMDWPRQLAEMMIRDRAPAQFSLQLHKILWPGAKEER